MDKKRANKNMFKLSSIQSIITLSFTTITVIAMIFTGGILFREFNQSIKKNTIISTSQILSQVDINLGRYISAMTEVSNLLKDDLRKYSSNDIYEIKNLFSTTLKLRSDIATLAVFSEDGELLVSTVDEAIKKNINVKKQEWFVKTVQNPNDLNFSTPHVENLFKAHHKWVVSLSRKIKYKQNEVLKNGIFLVNMNFSSIDELCNNVSLGKKGYVYIVDVEGDIIYHPQQQMIYAGIRNENLHFIKNRADGGYLTKVNGEQVIVNIKTEKFTGWKLIGVNYLDEMVASSKEIIFVFIFILFLGMFVVLLVCYLISARILKPIKLLQRVMKNVEKGEFDIIAEEKGENEVKNLSRTFNIMIRRIKQLMEQNLKEQEEKRRYELNALQAQINPHFLYNTLDSIVWLAENDENKEVVKMVTALANLFRISISKGNELITIKDEIEHARNYLVIQKIRYADKFDFDIQVQEDIFDNLTQKLILQPIIENAIYHGIKKMLDYGSILIKGSIVDSKICIEVIDNGVGMSQETANALLTKVSNVKNTHGIGVRNVSERIKLCFGQEYGLEILSELDEGTRVIIWIPKTKIGDN